MKSNQLITFLLIIITGLVHKKTNAQDLQWAAGYNGTGNSSDYPVTSVVDANGNSYITGQSQGAGPLNYVTVKYNSSGVQQWVREYNGTGNSIDTPNQIALDANGDVYVTGSSEGLTGGVNYATVKYSSNGIQQWATEYNGTGNGEDYGEEIAFDANGNVYITGRSFGTVGGYNLATVKYNNMGVQQWATEYDGTGSGNDEVRDIGTDASGNIYVTGYSYGLESPKNYNYVTVKYNSSGVQQWATEYKGAGNNTDQAFDLAVDASGNTYVTGRSWGVTGEYNYVTIKYNSGGVQQWATEYNGTGNGNDSGTDLVIDASGNVYVTGYSLAAAGGLNYATIKYNSNGVQQWVTQYDGTGNADDYARAIVLDASQNIYVTGYASGMTGGMNFVTLKYDNSGVQQWETEYNGTGNGDDIARGISLDGSGNIYVSGNSFETIGGIDFSVLKYCVSLSAKPTITLNGGILISNSTDNNQWYLNGVIITGETSQNYALTQSGSYTVTVTDVNGCWATSAPLNFITSGINSKTDNISMVSIYPNPFNTSTTLKINAAISKNMELKIYDCFGIEIRRFENIVNQEINIERTGFSKGIYLYTLKTTEKIIETGKLIVE